jgi:hypothetical protein
MKGQRPVDRHWRTGLLRDRARVGFLIILFQPSYGLLLLRVAGRSEAIYRRTSLGYEPVN